MDVYSSRLRKYVGCGLAGVYAYFMIYNAAYDLSWLGTSVCSSQQISIPLTIIHFLSTRFNSKQHFRFPSSMSALPALTDIRPALSLVVLLKFITLLSILKIIKV